MSVRQDILQKLATTHNGVADRIVGLALEDSAGQEQQELARLLLKRNSRTGWVSLIRSFDRLPDELRSELLNRPRELFGPLSDAMADSDGPSRLNIIEIVRKTADTKLAFLLTEALSDPRNEVRQAAGESLLEAIRRYRNSRISAWRHPDTAPEQVPDPQDLRKAIDFAIRQFKTHKRSEAIMAALLFERQQDSPIWLALGDPYEESARQAMTLLRQLNQPELAEAAILALSSPLKAAAIAGILFCDKIEVFSALAQQSYRLIDPMVRMATTAISNPSLLNHVPDSLPWDNQTWHDWLRLIDSLEMRPACKLEWFVSMINSAPAGSDGVPRKLMVMRSIAALQTPEAVQVIVELMSDHDERVARSATRWMMTRKPTNWKQQIGPLLMSPHASVRRLVSRMVTPDRFAHLWKHYETLPPAVQVTTARKISSDDNDFEPQLKNKLSHGSPAEIIQALRMVGTLSSLSPYRDQIIALCGHPDIKIAGTAVILTGRLNDPRLHDLLEAAAKHADPRVRANAIEAMEQLHIASQSQQIALMLNSRFNRERANAIKAICSFNFDQARSCLLKMLQDPNPMHRMSAMWVVNQIGILEIFRQVSTIARRDPNQHVRARAFDTLQKLTDVANAPAQAAQPPAPSAKPDTSSTSAISA